MNCLFHCWCVILYHDRMKLPVHSKWLLGVFVALLVMGHSASSAYANHFRAGTLSWEPVDGEARTVLVKGQIGWTNNHGHIPTSVAIGQVATGKLTLFFGDGQSVSAAVRVISRNATTNDVQTEIVSIKSGDSDYTVGIEHTYASDGDYTVYWGSSARESAENLDGSAWRNETLVNIGGTYDGNTSPVSAVAAVVQVPDNTEFTYNLVGVDVDGDDLQFRYGTKTEFFGSGDGEATRPTGLTLGTDGAIAWDVRDGTLSTDIGDRWQMTVMLEDLDESDQVKSKVPLDFVFLISDSSDAPPTISGPSSTTMNVGVGGTLNFSMSTNDSDWEGGDNSPTLEALNPPSTDGDIWSIDSSSSDGDTDIDVTFVPDVSLANRSFVVIFQATDDGGNSTTKTVTINVTSVTPTPTPSIQPTSVPRNDTYEAPPAVSVERPGCSRDYRYCANAGPNVIPERVVRSTDMRNPDNAMTIIEQSADDTDLWVTIDYMPVESLWTEQADNVQYPWAQGWNMAGDVYKYTAVTAKEGDPVDSLDRRRSIVMLHYDPNKLGFNSVYDLRIAWYNSARSTWEVMEENTVVKPAERLIANTTDKFGYFTVVYPGALLRDDVGGKETIEVEVPEVLPGGEIGYTIYKGRGVLGILSQLDSLINNFMALQ